MAIALEDLVRREWLKEIRNQHHLTVRGAAKVLGVSFSHYSDIENGRKSPSMQLAYKIGKLFEFEMERFLEN